MRSGTAPSDLPFFPSGVEREEKDCTRYLCLFIYSVNSFCAAALKRRRTFVHRDPFMLHAVFPRDLNSLEREVCSFASIPERMGRPRAMQSPSDG